MCADQPAVARAREHRGRELRRHLGACRGRRPTSTRRSSSSGLAPLAAIASARRCSSSLRDRDLRRAELLRDALEDARARILGAVDAVAEAHDPLLAGVERVGDPLLRRRPIASTSSSIGLTYAGAPPCSGPRSAPTADGERRAAVRSGRGDDPRGEGRGVEAVLGGADPVRVDRAHGLRIGLAAPLEEEPLRRGLCLRRPRPRAPRRRGPRRDAPTGDDRDHLAGDPAEILASPGRRRSR